VGTMSLYGKRVWIDIEQPKTAIMFNSLWKMFQYENTELLITARDYDSTYQILDNSDIKYRKIGRHGGEKLENKLETYIDRLKLLLPLIKKFSPHYFVTFLSIEGTRIAYGLKIPSIGMNDEPRNKPVCKLIHPFIENIITPKCIPKELYINLYADPEKIIRYNGLDEIAWISEYSPNPDILQNYDIQRGKYIIIRTEPTHASYLINKFKPEETQINEFLPPIFKEFPNYKYFLLVRSKKQKQYLSKGLKTLSKEKNIIITQYLPNLVDFCFHGALVISGGGTIVRESSLLNVPSIEFFPGESAPQETFLMNNGFPLEHIRDSSVLSKRAIEILDQGPTAERFKTRSFKEKINQFENPNKICFNFVKEKLKGK
jgi:predicted glycosyltransferase